MQMMKREGVKDRMRDEQLRAFDDDITRLSLIRRRDDHRQLMVDLIANIISGNPM